MLKSGFVAVLLLFVTSGYSQENVTDFLKSKGVGKSTYAIIIANEDYQSYSDVYTPNEELAIYQAEKFEQVLIKKLGVPPANIIFYPDATNTHIKLAIARLTKTMPSNSNIVFFYRGKTYSPDSGGGLYLVPVDVSDQETFYMFSVKDLCARLSDVNKAKVILLIDSEPGKKTGTASMLENGSLPVPDYTTSYKNMSLLALKPPAKPADVFRDVTDPNGARPEITITEPKNSSTSTTESSVFIKGAIKSDCILSVISVKGQEAHLMPDGTFIARVNLEDGENTIAVEAKNCAGWSRKNLTVTVHAKEEEKPQQNVETTGLSESGKNYAVIIGISKYRDPVMPDLYYPIQDARKVRDVLVTGYTFNSKNIVLLENPTKARIINTLDSLNNIITLNDNFLLFYAGHGTWDERTSMGYWLPSDAAAKVIDNWIMNSIITGYASEINAKHTLVIADACFGGSIFRTRAFMPEEEKEISELYVKTSKKAMTSGDLTEVPDQSIFVKNFLKLLSENTDDYLPSQKLFFMIKPTVVSAVDLIPQFGIIKNSGDQGGDFIFFRKKQTNLISK
jgi:hypothetical protein